MKFVIFGNLLCGPSVADRGVNWGPLCRALAQRGHAITFFVPGDAVGEAGAGTDVVRFDDFAQVRALVRRQLAEAEVAMVAWDFPDAAAASELVFESSVPLRVFHAMEAALSLGQLSAVEGGYPGPRGLADFDLVLSSIGGRALDDLLLRFHSRRVAALYPGADAAMFSRLPSVDRFHCDLSHVGAYESDREQLLLALWVKSARRLSHRRFLLGGAGYPENFPWTENMAYFRSLQRAEQPAVYAASRATLSLTSPAKRAVGHCPPSGLFEAAACGVPVLSDDWEGIGLFFEPGAEILPVRDAGDVITAMELSDAQLARIGERARERVLDEHTAAHRARHLEVVLENTFRAPEEEQLSAVRATQQLTEAEDWMPAQHSTPAARSRVTTDQPLARANQSVFDGAR